MDVRALLLEACERAQLSQAELARRAGLSSPSALSAWLGGRVSPTVASLTRVLAAADLQVRATLEPLLVELDARVDEVLAGAVALDLEAVAAFTVKAATVQRWPVEHGDGSVTFSTDTITWAFDGATALALNGLAFPQDVLAICLCFDGAAQSWLSKGFMIAPGADRLSYWGATFEEARDHLNGLAVGAHGMLRIRLVAHLPRVVRVQPADAEEAYPVVSVDAVEAAHPALGEVLARLRSRQGGPGREPLRVFGATSLT